MNFSTETLSVISIATATVAVLVLLLCAFLTWKLLSIRRAQQIVLGEGKTGDIVSHGATLQREFSALNQHVEDVFEEFSKRCDDIELELKRSITRHAVVRYDAYGELTGQQSTSLALLDESNTGLVLSSIHHRDHARLYVKRVFEGEGEVIFSPEEQHVIKLAMDGRAREEILSAVHSS